MNEMKILSNIRTVLLIVMILIVTFMSTCAIAERTTSNTINDTEQQTTPIDYTDIRTDEYVYSVNLKRFDSMGTCYESKWQNVCGDDYYAGGTIKSNAGLFPKYTCWCVSFEQFTTDVNTSVSFNDLVLVERIEDNEWHYIDRVNYQNYKMLKVTTLSNLRDKTGLTIEPYNYAKISADLLGLAKSATVSLSNRYVNDEGQSVENQENDSYYVCVNKCMIEDDNIHYEMSLVRDRCEMFCIDKGE